MQMVVLDHNFSDQLIAQRQANGQDRFDEVWEGIYMMSPAPNNEHQQLANKIARYLDTIIGDRQLGLVYPNTNVSDRDDGWTKNYRVPDVTVFLAGSSARDCGTHWLGGPDLAVEIVSEGDRSRDKVEFYESVNTRELLIVDRDPWQLELFRLTDGKLKSVAIATPGQGSVESALDVSLHLDAADAGDFDRPPMIMRDLKNDQSWTF